MSETAVAVLVLPVLIVVVVLLECSRAGCTRMVQHVCETRGKRPASNAQR